MSTGPCEVISSMPSGGVAAEFMNMLHQRRVEASPASLGAISARNPPGSTTPERAPASNSSRCSGVEPHG
jgi:hypothetical protein